MTRKEASRLWRRHRALIVRHLLQTGLPVVFLLVMGIGYVLMQVPAKERAERARQTREYRKAVEALRKDPSLGTHVTENPGWKDTGLRIDRMPWGRVNDGEKVIVWYRSESRRKGVTIRTWHWRSVDRVEELPTGAETYGWALVPAVLLVWLTAMTQWRFLQFLKERDDFVAATAHDLSTPLVGLRRSIGRADDEARLMAERMMRLVQNLKDFLELGGTRRRPETQVFDLMAAYREAYASFAPDYRAYLDGKDVPVSVENGAGDVVEVAGDPTLTVQILWNLLGNDLKYAAPFGRVFVRVVRGEGQVTFEIVDEGQGMTPHQMRRAFDRYYRARTVLESGKGGFGIGLCTSRELARAMGGDLTVKANEPRGCIFSLSLPAPNLI